MALIYTFRGVYGKDLTDKIAEKVGYFVGERLAKDGCDKIILGGDHRESTPIIKENIINGFLAHNLKILDIGEVPSPILAYTVKKQKKPGLMITASHNPPEWNGLQFHEPTSHICSPEWEEEIKSRLDEKVELDYEDINAKRKNNISYNGDIIKQYLDDLVSKIRLGDKKLKVIVDSGNGMATRAVPRLLDRLGVSHTEINSGIQSVPNRPYAPYPENLTGLKREIKRSKADAGFAYDGDSDRLVILDNKGNCFSGDLVTLLFCKDLLKPGNIVLSIETSFAVERELLRLGYNIENSRMGQTFLGEKVIEKDAIFAGEPNGHYTFPYFSNRGDGIASTAYFCQILSEIDKPLSSINKPLSYTKKEKFDWEKDISKDNRIGRYLIGRYGSFSKLNSRLYIGQDDDSRIIFRQSQFDPTLQLAVESYDKRLTDRYFEEARRFIYSLK